MSQLQGIRPHCLAGYVNAPTNLFSWSHVERRLTTTKYYWIWAVWLDGSIYFDGSPNHGSQFLELALKIINGEEMPGQVLVEEGIFSPEDAEALLPTGKY